MQKSNKKHTTNYVDTFIEVSEDTKATMGAVPNSKRQKKTIAEIQFTLLTNNPYKFTSDDIIFQTFAERNDLPISQYKKAREQFFLKGQPCLRASPLTKTCGFGIHNNNTGKIALYGMETKEYQSLVTNKKIKKVKAMRNAKNK